MKGIDHNPGTASNAKVQRAERGKHFAPGLKLGQKGINSPFIRIVAFDEHFSRLMKPESIPVSGVGSRQTPNPCTLES
jgi:hypothetical protein